MSTLTEQTLTTATEAPFTITAIARVYYRLVKSPTSGRKIESVPLSVRAQVQWLLDEDIRLEAEKAAAEAQAQAEAQAEAETPPVSPVAEESPSLAAPE